jgi:helicase required for RNAi-mediated heterochromatin assembly 1
LRELKKDPSLAYILYFKVFTVDSYQGEENDVIMLSLVRSNTAMTIGFLENKNRLVVALSRARRGLYIYGNSVTLVSGEESEDYVGRSQLWGPLIFHMKCQGWYDVDGGLPIYCEKHNEWTRIRQPDDWVGLNGGCEQKCGGTLDCGHPCVYACHPFDHSTVPCGEPCPLMLICGHMCRSNCGTQCKCDDSECTKSGFLDIRSNSFAEVVSRNQDIRSEEGFQCGASIPQHNYSSHTKGSNKLEPWMASNLGVER